DAYDAVSNSGIVCIGKENDGYFIRSGNTIENTDELNLRAHLDRVLGKSKDELKLMFKEQMKKELEPGKNGAGIGFIDIARKASQPIEYSIKKIDETYSFYEIMVKV
ncbi:MAG: SiaB family protein kinase, partial [Bacillota bacterium]|nr:SiaB family protein kinase [Bacillota bacterium]